MPFVLFEVSQIIAVVLFVLLDFYGMPRGKVVLAFEEGKFVWGVRNLTLSGEATIYLKRREFVWGEVEGAPTSDVVYGLMVSKFVVG